MQKWGLNTYLYGPKDDLKHRLLWREVYSSDEEGKSPNPAFRSCCFCGHTDGTAVDSQRADTEITEGTTAFKPASSPQASFGL